MIIVFCSDIFIVHIYVYFLTLNKLLLSHTEILHTFIKDDDENYLLAIKIQWEKTSLE